MVEVIGIAKLTAESGTNLGRLRIHRRGEVGVGTVISGFFAALLLSQVALAADFRGASWGDDIDSVKKQESESLVGDHSNNLIYAGKLAGINVYIVYTFKNGKLIEGEYHNQSNAGSGNDYIQNFAAFRDLLRKKYGPPLKDRVMWRDTRYKNDSNLWGEAVRLGHLLYTAKWETGQTRISTTLWGDKGSIQHVIKYSEKGTEKRERLEQEKRTLEKL